MSHSYFVLRGAAVTVMGLAFGPASALSLAEAIIQARQTDPIYLGAQAGQVASRERESQALANLLPQVSISANTNDNHRNYTVRETELAPSVDRYNGNNAQLSVNQPLWRSANRIARTQAQSAVAQADFQVAAAEQDLLVRLGQAWFDLMQARDAQLAAKVQIAATQFEMQQLHHALKIGLTSAPPVEEARMKHDQALAEYSAAQADYGVKLAALEQIVGPLSALTPPVLAEKYASFDLRDETMENWVAQAEAESPAIAAAARALDAANAEIRKQRAGHEPTLDLVATYGRNGQAAGSFPGQNGYAIKQGTIGLQLAIPLYSGGGQNAKMREAIALRDKVAQDLVAAKRSVRFNSKQAWFIWHASHARQSAALQAVKFTATALNAATLGQARGVKAELDVLQASRQFYAASRDLQKARYDMITSYLKLRASAGRLTDADLTALDRWFDNGGDPQW